MEPICTLPETQAPARSAESDAEISARYEAYCKPGFAQTLRLLKMDAIYTRGSGDVLYRLGPAGEETPVLDLLGGYGSTILGHNHPVPRSALRKALDQEVPMNAQASIRPGAAALGELLNRIVRADAPYIEGEPPEFPKYLLHLASTGTEAVEAALKHALMAWHARRSKVLTGLSREKNKAEYVEQNAEKKTALERLIRAVERAEPVFLALEGAFHGKTAGSLSATYNTSYSWMYEGRAVLTRFIPPNASEDEVRAAFAEHLVMVTEQLTFSSLAGVLIEPVQGEGGVRPLTPEFASLIQRGCRLQGVPLIADEIQTGVYRTGRFLASHSLGLRPDYVTLGKSLGGGVSKISALLVREDLYEPEFGIVHTSTFAEDELSSRVAADTLDFLASNSRLLSERAERFEKRVKESFEEIMRRYPGVIREVRGKGFLLGVEFFQEIEGKPVLILEALAGTGYLAYVHASYLLHRHGVRVAATLNRGGTLRIEPSAFLSDEAVEKALSAFEDLVKTLHERRFTHLTSHLWPEGERLKDSPIASPFAPGRILRKTPHRKVAFLSHYINTEHLRAFDPLFNALSPGDRKYFLSEVGPIGRTTVYHEQLIEGLNGETVHLQLHGLSVPSSFFEESLRAGDLAALGKVREGVEEAFRRENLTHVGLGQFTSIVTENGTLLPGRPGWNVTTGNSLTVGFAFEALLEILKKRGIRLSDCRVGVVGVAGNICNTYAQLVADRARELVLVHREPIELSPKFQRAVKEVLLNSTIRPERVVPRHDIEALAGCDVVILGTNSSKQFLMPAHLKKDAIVLDISVPSNIHPSVFESRPDVECFQGGYARLPAGQKLLSRLVPTPDGEIFACMAETLTVGLLNYQGCFSQGPLSKSQILRILDMAREVGISVGSLKKMASF